LFSIIPAENPLLPGHWSQNPWIRTALGVSVTLGVFLCLRRCVEAAWAAGDPTSHAANWAGWSSFLAWQGLMIVALFLGGVMVGAGQPAGGLFGALVGLANGFAGVIFFGNTPEALQGIPDVLYWGQPVYHMILGLMGGMVGARIWPPLTVQKPPSSLDKDGAGGWLGLGALWASLNLANVRIRWFRVLLGSGFAIAGLFFARQLFDMAVKNMGIQDVLYGNVGFQKHLAVTLFTALAVFAGAFFSGSSTTHGMFHGAWVALITCIGYMISERYHHPDRPLEAGDIAPFLGIIVALCLVAGSLGGRLMPPVVRAGKRKVTPMAEI
jgi:hypothetical protein